jgi:hypothetical protein
VMAHGVTAVIAARIAAACSVSVQPSPVA